MARRGRARRAERVIALPVRCPTCPAFGGPDLDVLYLTSATIGLTAAGLGASPGPGGSWVPDPRVRGLPEARFPA
jgi:L-arabinonolactonase